MVAFVLLVAPLAGGAVVAGGVHGHAFGFEVVEDVVVGPMPHGEKLGGAIFYTAHILHEGDAAFDEIDIGAFLPVEGGIPRPVEGTARALEHIGEAAEVAALADFALGGMLGAEAQDKGAVMSPLVVFEEIETGCAGLDVVAIPGMAMRPGA